MLQNSKSSNSEIQLQGHLSWCCVDDVVFILDSISGQYYGLPPKQAELWLLFFPDRASSGKRLDMFERDDAASFLTLLREKNWIVDAKGMHQRQTRARSAAPVWQFTPGLDAFYCLIRVSFTLRFVGFHAAYSWAKLYATPMQNVGVSAAKPLEFDAAMENFYRAERFLISHRGLDDCLPRSLALFIYLRRCGLYARHVIGVKRFPFVAHAWVEYASKILLVAKQYGVTPNMASPEEKEPQNGFFPISEIE